MTGRCLVLSRGHERDVFGALFAALAARGWSLTIDSFEPPAAESGWWQRQVDAARASRNRLMGRAAAGLRRAYTEYRWADAASTWFQQVEARLREPWDVVLVSPASLPTGTCRLVARHPHRSIIINMAALQSERAWAPGLAALRVIAAATSSATLHHDVMRPVATFDRSTVICPSLSWQQQTVAAGVPPDIIRVIPLGVRAADPRPGRPLGSPVRLLWAGRLSPEKGLHLFLDALPLIDREARVSLTVIALDGPVGYRRAIEAQIVALGLGQIVTMAPPVSRDALPDVLSGFDLLLFHSVFAEPVAQVMLQAAAAGVPVVGPASAHRGSLLNERTAWCYGDESPATIARTVLAALHDADARAARVARLRAEVRRAHSFEYTVEQFDSVLREAASLPSVRTQAEEAMA